MTTIMEMYQLIKVNFCVKLKLLLLYCYLNQMFKAMAMIQCCQSALFHTFINLLLLKNYSFKIEIPFTLKINFR